MRSVFRFLYECGVRPDQLLSCVEEIPLMAGVKEMFQVTLRVPYRSVYCVTPSNQCLVDRDSEQMANSMDAAIVGGRLLAFLAVHQSRVAV